MSPFQKFLNKFATKKVVAFMLVIAAIFIIISILGFTGVLESLALKVQSGS